jgi:tryptophanyl-tRNA synthetase
VSNLLSIYSALSGRSIEELEKDYSGKGYGDLTGDLAQVVGDVLTPFRERTLGYLDDPAALDAVLAEGAEKARAVAATTLEQVYDRVGFLRPAGRARR